jgi:hypothetical protein
VPNCSSSANIHNWTVLVGYMRPTPVGVSTSPCCSLIHHLLPRSGKPEALPVRPLYAYRPCAYVQTSFYLYLQLPSAVVSPTRKCTHKTPINCQVCCLDYIRKQILMALPLTSRWLYNVSKVRGKFGISHYVAKVVKCVFHSSKRWLSKCVWMVSVTSDTK